MEGECFFVKNGTLSERKERFFDDAYDINLDSALKELGMLSTITDSRIDYLKEQDLECLKDKMKRKCCNSLPPAPLCVVHMNSDFVTQFSVSKNSAQSTEFEVPDELKPKLLVRNKMNQKRKRKLYAPYIINRQIIPPEKFEEEFNECKDDILAEEQASPPPPPPIISRQDSGNKSNPSSPVKSQNSLTSVGCSIFRSRSLDDLEISKLYNYNESCDESHGEIDTVSQRISKLHVS